MTPFLKLDFNYNALGQITGYEVRTLSQTHRFTDALETKAFIDSLVPMRPGPLNGNDKMATV